MTQDKTSCVTNANRRNDRCGRFMGHLRDTVEAKPLSLTNQALFEKRAMTLVHLP